MTTIGKSIITIKTDEHNNIPDLTTDNGIQCFTWNWDKKRWEINGDWDLTTMFRPITDSGGRSKSYKYLSLDLHNLIRIDGEFDLMVAIIIQSLHRTSCYIKSSK